jgi:hypothetical protein
MRTSAADGVHRVDVTQDQDPRSVAAPGRARLQQIAEAVHAGYALHVGADAAHVVLHPIRHAVDRLRVLGG